MAKFSMELPTEIMHQFQTVDEFAHSIFGEMTRAGAEVVKSEIEAHVPDGIRNSDMMSCLYITKTYETPSDGGINTKIGFYGYFTNEDGKLTPAPLVANVYEYGRSDAPFPKQPFLRKSFNRSKIEKAMLEKQKEASGGLLE